MAITRDQQAAILRLAELAFPRSAAQRARRVDLALTDDGRVRGERVHGELAPAAVPAIDVSQVPIGEILGGLSADNLATFLEEIASDLGGKQPLDAQLTDIAGLTPADNAVVIGNGSNFVAESGATLRTSIGVPATGAALTESAEAESVTAAGNTSHTPGADLRLYDFFTLPTTEKWYVITGIEWKNHATVAGSIWCGVDLVDGDPPTDNNTVTVAWGKAVAQAGTSTTQRNSAIASTPIRGGSVCGVWIVSNSATATFGVTGGASVNNRRSITAGTPELQHSAAWSASANHPYVKAFYVGIR
jgi:hypothetical protein